MKAVVLCCGVALVAGSYAAAARQSLPLTGVDWGSATAGLRMAISSVPGGTEPAAAPQFHIVIENMGDSDVVINLGSMLSNGRVMFPEAVRMVLTDSQGARELQYFDRRYPAIAGRVDDFIVGLRAGSLYAIRVSLDQYWSIKLPRGQYRIEARFEGQGAQSLNLDTPGIALLNFWKGILRSNSLAFEIP